jgi:hypothetical protein
MSCSERNSELPLDELDHPAKRIHADEMHRGRLLPIDLAAVRSAASSSDSLVGK